MTARDGTGPRYHDPTSSGQPGGGASSAPLLGEPHEGYSPFVSEAHARHRRYEVSFAACLMAGMAVTLAVGFLVGRLGWPW